MRCLLKAHYFSHTFDLAYGALNITTCMMCVFPPQSPMIVVGAAAGTSMGTALPGATQRTVTASPGTTVTFATVRN